MLLREVDWLPRDLQAVCLSQAVTAGNQFIINGNLSNINAGIESYRDNVPGVYVSLPSIMGGGYYQTQTAISGYIANFKNNFRTVSIDTSGADFSTYNFTITGTYCGKLVSEVVVGGNSNVVESGQLFELVNSVTCDQNVLLSDNITIGTGLYGHIGLWQPDYLQPISGITVQVIVPVSGSLINWTAGFTLVDAPNLSAAATPPSNGTATLLPYMPDISGTNLTDKAESMLSPSFVPTFRYVTVFITDGGSGTDNTGQLKALFLNNGI